MGEIRVDRPTGSGRRYQELGGHHPMRRIRRTDGRWGEVIAGVGVCK